MWIKINYFFRGIEDVNPLKIFSLTHIILIIFYIIGLVLICRNREFLRKSKYNLLKIMASILLIDQVILYAWQILSGFFRLDVSLPLYHCRLAVPLLIFGIFFNNKKCKILGMYWGILGSVIAMVMADLYKFQFPHYTNFQFFIVHIIMGWIIFHFLFVDKMEVTKEENIFVLKATTIYNVFLAAFNLILLKTFPEINYGYMINMPEAIGKIFPPAIHAILMITIFNATIYLLYKLFNYIHKKVNK